MRDNREYISRGNELKQFQQSTAWKQKQNGSLHLLLEISCVIVKPIMVSQSYRQDSLFSSTPISGFLDIKHQKACFVNRMTRYSDYSISGLLVQILNHAYTYTLLLQYRDPQLQESQNPDLGFDILGPYSQTILRKLN